MVTRDTTDTDEHGTEAAWKRRHSGDDTGSSGADEIRHEMGERATRLMDAARLHARSAVEEQQKRVAEQIGNVADALHEAAERFDRHDQRAVAHYTDIAADRVARFADNLRTRGANEMLADLEDFARRQPALFVGGAFAMGFFAARFLKSSGQHRYGETSDYESPGGYGPSADSGAGAYAAAGVDPYGSTGTTGATGQGMGGQGMGGSTATPSATDMGGMADIGTGTGTGMGTGTGTGMDTDTGASAAAGGSGTLTEETVAPITPTDEETSVTKPTSETRDGTTERTRETARHGGSKGEDKRKR